LVLSTNLSLEVKPLAGLTAPTNELIRVVEDANVLLDLSYSVVPPQFISHPQFGLGLLGTPGTCYRIETKAEQESDARWLPLQKVALEPGTNWVSGPTPSESTGRVYRAVWLSE